MHAPLTPPTLADARAAAARIAGVATRTPLLRLPADAGHTDAWLKLECLQPIGSFKLRGAANAMALAGDDAIARGVYTASAGNMAQGVAWCARERGVRCQVIVPEHAPRTKTDAIERLGGTVIRVPFEQWWQTLIDHGAEGMEGLFVHPFADDGVMAGNGTVALEILEDLDGIDTIIVPYGGGGLACGIAAVAKEIHPGIRVVAVEVDTAAPVTASFAAGAPTAITYQRSFVDGMGSGGVSAEMWPMARALLDGTTVVTLAQVAAAVKLLVERARIVTEGAGAAAIAAALTPAFAGQRTVCIASGGNIDAEKLAVILRGDVP